MPDILRLVSIWKKEILFLVLLSTITTTAVVFVIPGKYLAISTALPTNAAAADKSTVFNNNIQELYTALGTPDDVDKIVGTGQLDTIYLATAEEFHLPEHYNVKEKGKAAYLKAAMILKSDSKVTKSEYGELQVRVWDKDKQLAPQLANSIIEKLAALHQNLQGETNRAVIQSLLKTQLNLQVRLDSFNSLSPDQQVLIQSRRSMLVEQIQQYEKLKNEYQIMLDSNPAALVIVEKARQANWPDKPKRVIIIIAAVILSFVFAVLIALLLERRKRKS